MALPAGFRDQCQSLLNVARDAGWETESEQAIPYGRLFRLMSGASRATLSCYHGKKGFRHVVAGKDGDTLASVLGGGPSAPATVGVGGDDPFSGGLPRIGADESGKGDYFGPLVVAAFYIDENTQDALRGIGVRDSKRLSRPQALRMADELDRLERGHVIALHPVDYTERYAELNNVNTLLSELHGACISHLIQRGVDEGWAPPHGIVVDRFSTRTRPMDRAITRPRSTKLITAPKAEADAAVAAASILARAAFLEALQGLEQQYGVAFPPGAGTPVLKAGREFVRSFGRDELVRVAKVHFATTEQL